MEAGFIVLAGSDPPALFLNHSGASLDLSCPLSILVHLNRW